MTSVAEYMVKQLAAWGVERIYGVVGDTLFPFMDAIERHPTLRFVPVRNEAAAGFMAAAEAKLTGRPTCCLATSGPGISNLLTGLGDAHADQVGVVAITGQVERRKIGTETKQYIDQQSLVRPLVGYTSLLADPEAAGHILPTALRAAVGEGRVAHISVPKDLWLLACDAVVVPYEPYLGTPARSEVSVIQGAIDRMMTAERPLVLMGQGARPAAAAVVELAERWGAGILQSLPAKGAVPWRHPLMLGGLGSGGTDAAHTAIQEADMLLAIGVNWWPEKHVPLYLPVIKLDRSPAHIGGKMAVHYGLAGDVTTVVPQMAAGVDLCARPAWRSRLNDLRDAWEIRLESETADGAAPPSPQQIVRMLERLIPPDAVVALDTGDHTVWFNRVFGGERHDVLMSGKWRSLGFGLPAALAAKLAQPHRTAVALVGDTALQSQLGELVTAAELGLDVVVVVVNNGMMAIEYNRATTQGHSTLGTAPRNPDFARLATACGLSAHSARSGREFMQAMQAALSASGPVLIDVATTAPVAPTAGG